MKSAILTVLAIFATCPLAAQTADQKAFAKQLVLEEPVIKDALWMTASNLYVGVLDDGSRRDGFAAYVCNDAKQRGAKMVKVVDIAKLKRTGKFVEIGISRCM